MADRDESTAVDDAMITDDAASLASTTHAAAATIQKHARGRKVRQVRQVVYKQSHALGYVKQILAHDDDGVGEMFDVNFVQNEALMHLEKMMKQLTNQQNAMGACARRVLACSV